MRPETHDVENQYFSADLTIDASESLLQKIESASSKPTRHLRRSLEVIELDDIPPIIKSANGNIFWADEQCTRRVGLTSSEARLFYNLLKTDEDELENWNYAEYKEMFQNFSLEQKRLQALVKDIGWWELSAEGRRRKEVWQARIEWLERMKEPMLWLSYLIARRRRILVKAAGRCLVRLGEKSSAKTAKEGDEKVLHAKVKTEGANMQPAKPVMRRSDDSQTSEILRKMAVSESISAIISTPTTSHSLTSHTPSSLNTSNQNNHSHSPQGQTTTFDKRFQATRKDIKHQVELLMPKPQPYIVIGMFLRSASDPRERILQFDDPADLFKQLRHGQANLRSWRRIGSLKALRGFGLYKCDISRGAHIQLTLDSSQKAVLAKFFLAYKASKRHSDEAVARAWQGWVHKNLNSNKNNPLEGRYSLELVYDWSSYRLSLVVAVPLVLSFVIGVWYMLTPGGDVVTAWTLAMYIVAAAAGRLLDRS